jgi:hypothetical protein
MLSCISYCYQGIKSLFNKEKCYVKCNINAECCQYTNVKVCNSNIPIPSRLHKFILKTRNRHMPKNQSSELFNDEIKDNCFHRLITW